MHGELLAAKSFIKLETSVQFPQDRMKGIPKLKAPTGSPMFAGRARPVRQWRCGGLRPFANWSAPSRSVPLGPLRFGSVRFSVQLRRRVASSARRRLPLRSGPTPVSLRLRRPPQRPVRHEFFRPNRRPTNTLGFQASARPLAPVPAPTEA